MKLTITKITENQYTFQEGENEIINLTEKSIIIDKRTQCSYLKLPENSLKIQSINLKRFKDTDTIEFENMRTQRQTNSTEKSSRKSLKDYMTDEEKKIIEEIEEKCRMRKEEEEKKQRELKNNPIEKAKKKVNSIIENLKNLGMSEESIMKLISQK